MEKNRQKTDSRGTRRSVRQAAPRTWDVAPDGEASPVECSFVMLGPHHFGFRVPGRRPERALWIDPGLVYSSYLGSGAPYDRVFDLALDATGAVIAAGATHGAFPTTPGAFDESPGGFLAGFVARLSPGGASLDGTK